MPSKAAPRPTIRQAATELFLAVSYVDVHGRSIGYDHSYILEEIKRQFPNAHPTRHSLRQEAARLNRTERMPMRRSSRRMLAEGFAETQLIQPSTSKHRLKNIAEAIQSKFPGQKFSANELRIIGRRLVRQGFTVPVLVPA